MVHSLVVVLRSLFCFFQIRRKDSKKKKERKTKMKVTGIAIY